MTSYEAALLLHLLAVIGFFSGVAVAGAAQLAARRRGRAGEVAAVLAVARSGVLLVAVGTALVLVSGLWLIEETGRSLGDAWIALSLALLVGAVVLGALGGRTARKARLAAEGQPPDAPLEAAARALLGDRASLAANAGATLAALGVLVLMIWRPE